MSSASANELAARAVAAERAGQSQEAEALWAAVLKADPEHPQALFVAGRTCVQRGDAPGAISLLERAEKVDPRNPEVPLFLALAYNMQGAYEAGLAAIERALVIDPYFFMALLSKATLLERMGRAREAARAYRNALKTTPTQLPPNLKGAVEHAEQVVAENAEALAKHLRESVSALRNRYASEDLARFDESLDILAGVKQRQTHDPLLLYYPRLAPIPFYDRALFPWLPELEAATDTIRAELDVVMREDLQKFAPYIQFPPGAPVNQWVELNHSPAWSTFFLWRDGVRQDEGCTRCPNTAALLDRLPLQHQRGYAPTAMFSLLKAHAHIPPHTGSSNARLIVHLPLILPAGCRFRVGNDTRDWRMGEAWVFDDTIEHEAWNDSGEIRVILIFDIWNPYVTEAERELITEMMAALNAFNTG